MDDLNTIKTIWSSFSNNIQDLLLAPSAEKLGNAMGNLIEVFTFPVSMAGIYARGELKKYEEETQAQINKISADQFVLDRDNLNLIIDAIEKSKYQLNNDFLRNMFVKLIRSTVDKRKNKDITPRFASVLKDLSVNDAKLLRDIANQKCNMPLNISGYVDQSNNHQSIRSNVLYFNQEYKTTLATELSLNVLESLGILKEAEYEISLDDLSEEVHSEIIREINRKNKEDLTQKVVLLSKPLNITEFGKAFISCVVDTD